MSDPRLRDLLTAFILVVFLLAASLLGGCERMRYQPSSRPLAESDFFEDGKAARTPPEGSVSREFARVDPVFWSGRAQWRAEQPTVPAELAPAEESSPDTPPTDYRPTPSNANFVARIPVEVDQAFVERGGEMYRVYCVPCHGHTGHGRGTVTDYGYPEPPSYHQQRLREAPDGYLFDVISNGFGLMYGYAHRIRPRDRWAIVAYVRALQLSRHATRADVPNDVTLEEAQ